MDSFPHYPLFFLFLFFSATPDGPCSRLTPGEALGVSGIEPEWAECKANSLPTALSLQSCLSGAG